MISENNMTCLNFQSVPEEIQWHLTEAELGYTKIQHRLGSLYLESACNVEDLYPVSYTHLTLPTNREV